MKKCIKCGIQNVDQAKFCKKCGEPLPEASETPTKKFCSNCGQPLKEGAQFCANCGKPVSFSESVERNSVPFVENKEDLRPLPKKDKTLYVILGVIGVVLAIGVLVGVFSLFGSGSSGEDTVKEAAKIESQQNSTSDSNNDAAKTASDQSAENTDVNTAEAPEEASKEDEDAKISETSEESQEHPDTGNHETEDEADNSYQARINEQFNRYYNNEGRTYTELENDYKEADNLLNEIYQRIKDHMISSGQVSADKFSKTQLVQEEKEWIKTRDAAAEAADSDWGAIDEKIYFTLMRCQELLDNYALE